MKRSLISLLSIVAAMYIGFGTLLYVFQRNLLYFPAPKINHGFAELVFKNEGESVTVVVLNQGKGDAIIYFGGNAESVAVNAAEFSRLYPNHTLYLVNYRGYAGSSGQPTETGNYSDALFIFDRIRPEFSDISIIGRSLGSGVATYVAANRQVSKLVLVTPFDSVLNVARKRFHLYPVTLILKDKYDSVGRVSKIGAQTLVLIAEHDEVIPLSHTQHLVDAFPASRLTVITILKTGHNTISSDPRYSELLQEFI